MKITALFSSGNLLSGDVVCNCIFINILCPKNQEITCTHNENVPLQYLAPLKNFV